MTELSEDQLAQIQAEESADSKAIKYAFMLAIIISIITAALFQTVI